MNISISSLNLCITHRSYYQLINLLQKISHLINLTLQIETILIDGHQWEQMKVNHLSKLKVFRFAMYFDIDVHHSYETEVDRILHSYRSSFWLIDRRWFVRYQLYKLHSSSLIILHSLPYAFDSFAVHSGTPENLAKSTCPSKDYYWSFDRVIALHSQLGPLNGTIRHLNITFPMCDEFLSTISSFDHLISLVASNTRNIDSDNALAQLQCLIDRAPRLYSLTLETWPSSIIQEIPCKILL